MKPTSARRHSIRVEDVLPAGWLDLLTQAPQIALGVDLATTTNKKSNPTSIALLQRVGLMKFVRVLLRFKTADGEITRIILRLILDGLKSRGLAARRLCIDATNERLFAVDLRREFAGKVPVELIIASEKTEYGGEEMLWKAYLGNLLVDEIEDGYLPLPGGKWVQTDLRQPVKDRGTFVCEVSEDGGHGDCFDAIKNGLHGLIAKGGPVDAVPMRVGSYGAGASYDSKRDAGRLRAKARAAGARRSI